jgi:hypothetical protein
LTQPLKEIFRRGKGGRCVALTTLPPPGTLKACLGPLIIWIFCFGCNSITDTL